MFHYKITAFGAVACATVGWQLFTSFLPAFTFALTQTERHLHYGTTLLTVALLWHIYRSYESKRSTTLAVVERIALMCFLLSLIAIEQLLIGAKTLLPLFSQRVAFVLVAPLALYVLSIITKTGASCVPISSKSAALRSGISSLRYRRR